VSRFALLSIQRPFIFPIFDYGSVVYDNRSQTDVLGLGTAQITAAKIITGYLCTKTTANDAVLKDVSFVRLSSRRNMQILIYYDVWYGVTYLTTSHLDYVERFVTVLAS